jgi:rfaE bifunctional protein nucleotidyltransferase chain/domain
MTRSVSTMVQAANVERLDLSPSRARQKIRTVEEIAEMAAHARAAGCSVVLCHGVFDLMHMGHVRHLEAARREGDLLVVSVTEDRFVNKGPGRPAFPAPYRAEMLAAMACVDWVAISNWPTAEGVIRLLRPDVYVKGSDYRNVEDDVTGMIDTERAAVEEHGGRVIFTDDITYSSSSLINKHLGMFDPAVDGYLNPLREGDFLSRVLSAIDDVQGMKVLLVGDAIIDEYQYAAPMGKSAKENIIASRFERSEVFAGGVFAAANHVADFCREVEVVSCLGRQDSHEDLIRESMHPNVALNLVYREDAPTTRKCRFVEPGHMRKMFEIYHFNDTPLVDQPARQVRELIGDKASEFDLVIVTDFGHGLVGRQAIDLLTDKARFLAVNAQSNSANLGYNLITKYGRADYICIDEPEARLAMSDRFGDVGEVITVGLRSAVDCDRIIVTHGQYGCVTFEPDAGIARIPAFTRQVLDTVGAGDAFLAITSPLIAGGADMDVAGFVGNAVGAIKVGIVGHRTSVEKVPLKKFVTGLLK